MDKGEIMNYSFDNYGWLDDVDISDRSTSITPPAHGGKTVGQFYPNFTGTEWVLAVYANPPVAPAPVIEAKFWSAFDFYRRFTPSERISARELVKTDAIAEDFLHTLDAAIASGANILADDPDTIAGMGYLVLKGVITQTRHDEIIKG